MRVILAAFIVAAGVGTLASSGASAAPANGAAIANASAQTSTCRSDIAKMSVGFRCAVHSIRTAAAARAAVPATAAAAHDRLHRAR
ncbi:MAG: hypothetical protein WAM77_05795, partial [Xanthobacteraceae bacterium]